jgi:hypothetical protein
MRIAFHDNSLCLRGTTVAIYDWAYWTRHYLSIDPIIMFNLKNNFNDKSVIKKFEKEFPVFGYEDKSQIDDILSKNKCDAFLMEKGGEPDGVISSGSKNLVNAISGWWKPEWVHGDVYAMGSKWLSKITDYKIPYVPYIVHLPNHNLDMRDELGIPKDALVFGRNGGWDTFDLQFVKQSIVENLEKRSNIWFIFQYTEPFYEHERIIYLEPTADLNEKVRFINTSDVMLHARNIGESFGLSCAEFSIRNKPVITYYNSLERNHIDTLDERGIFYENKEDIDHILLNLDRNEINGLEWNCYQDYSPENVVQKFKEVYL